MNNQTGGDLHNGSFFIDETHYKKSVMRKEIVKFHCAGCNCLESEDETGGKGQ